MNNLFSRIKALFTGGVRFAPSYSAELAKRRLRGILAYDHVERKTRRATGAESLLVFLDKAQPVLLLERFAETPAMPLPTGTLIKWRKPVPFDVTWSKE